MKVFEELTLDQQEEMIGMAFYELMGHIATGLIEITLTHPESQKRFEAILTKGREKESARLTRLYLLHDKPIRAEIYRLATAVAVGTQYTDAGDPVTKVSENEVDQYFSWEQPGRTGTESYGH